MHLRTRAVHALPYGMDERDATFRKEVEGSCIHAIPKTRRSIQTDLRMASKTTNIAEGGMQPEITKWPLRFSWNYNPRYLRLYGAGSAAVRGGPQTPQFLHKCTCSSMQLFCAPAGGGSDPPNGT